MRILVLDGNENQAVAATRSLNRAGHRVLVGASTRWSKAGWSRAASGRFRYPAPESDMEGFVAAVVERTSTVPGTLVLPMTERSTLPLSLERSRLYRVGARMVLPPHETLLRAFDKDATTELARSLGLRVPAFAVVTNGIELASLTATLRFPLVLKGTRSEELLTSGGIRSPGAPHYARTPTELRSAYRALGQRSSAVMIQEFIPGTGTGYFALVREGEVLAEFAHRRIRDVRPTGSGSAVRVSIALPEGLRRAGRSLLEALRWQGVAMVEFRQAPSGELYFLEINGRFWNSLALAVYAGADFPAWVAELAERGRVDSVRPYRPGVRCRWWLGDARHLVEVLRGPPRGFPGSYPSRLQTAAQFLLPRPGTLHDNFMLNDPLPELGDWIHFLFRKLPGHRDVR